MSINTNYQVTVIAQLKLIAESMASVGSGATEATALAILAALNSIDLNLTNNTNTLLAQIRDSNVAQEALITSTNTILGDIRLDLADLEAQQIITNSQLVDANTELDNIEATLNSIEASNVTFYTNLLAQQAAIETLLTNLGVDTVTIISRLDTLITQTDQVETLLGNIVTALATNSSVNAAALEQLRLLLVAIDANTDAVESELINIIAEHDQTQVLLTNTNTILTNISNIDFATENTALISRNELQGINGKLQGVTGIQDLAPLFNNSLLVGTERQDNITTSTSSDGDVQRIKSTNLGEIYTKDLSAGQLLGNLTAQGAEASNNYQQMIQLLAQIENALGNLDGDNDVPILSAIFDELRNNTSKESKQDVIITSLDTDIKPLLETIENHTDGATTELGEIKLLVDNSGNYSHEDLTVGVTLYGANSFKEFEFIVLTGTADVTINGNTLTYSALSKIDGFKLKNNTGINQAITITTAVGSTVRVIYKDI